MRHRPLGNLVDVRVRENARQVRLGRVGGQSHELKEPKLVMGPICVWTEPAAIFRLVLPRQIVPDLFRLADKRSVRVQRFRGQGRSTHLTVQCSELLASELGRCVLG